MERQTTDAAAFLISYLISTILDAFIQYTIKKVHHVFNDCSITSFEGPDKF